MNLFELQHQGDIQWLILSRENLGKTGAQNWIFSAMPNEWIAYTDSDVLFRKGWLEASREIIRALSRSRDGGSAAMLF